MAIPSAPRTAEPVPGTDEPDRYFYERQWWARGARYVAGLDEVGRGCLCGPVLAAAVIFAGPIDIPGLDDSKRLTAKQRQRLFGLVQAQAAAVALGAATSREIDAVNILQATRLAMARALRRLNPQPDALLIDALFLPGTPVPQMGIIRGDQLSASISAASVVAKVVRDDLMRRYHRRHPGYGLDRNAGYPTAEHKSAIQQLGLTPCHRRTFHGVKEWVIPAPGAAPAGPAAAPGRGWPLFSGSD